MSDLLVFGKRAGEYAATYATENGSGQILDEDVSNARNTALAPFERPDGENPYAIQYDLQEMMQDFVGIVRKEEEMLNAISGIEKLNERAERVGVSGNVEFNPGWHTALDIPNLLTVSEAIARAAVERRESRGAQFREDYPGKEEDYSTFNISVSKGENGQMEIKRIPIPELPDELKQIIKEMG